MSFGIANFDSLPHNVKLAFEDLEAWVATFLLKEHNADGTHTLKSGTTTLEKQMSASGRWWTGPGAWLLDDPTSDTPNAAVLTQVRVEGGTYNNFTTQGLDNCVILDINPEDTDLVLTGLQARPGHVKRIMGLRNGDPGARIITLKHNDSGSLEPNRFRLPKSTDLVLASNQIAWMFWNRTSGTAPFGWYLFTTPHQSGGLASMGSTSATVSLSQVQIEALGTTDVEIVPAPGAGLILIPDTLSVEIDTTSAYGASGTWRTKYSTSAWDGFGLHADISADLNNVRKKLYIRPPAGSSFTAGYGTRDPRNKAIVMEAAADPTGAGAATATVTLLYHTVTALT